MSIHLLNNKVPSNNNDSAINISDHSKNLLNNDDIENYKPNSVFVHVGDQIQFGETYIVKFFER